MRDIEQVEKPYRETSEYRRMARIARMQNELQSLWSRQPGHTWADASFDDQDAGPGCEEVTGNLGWADSTKLGLL